ncbi:MAG: DNA polymerase/3'-5' exonuclease PolX [Candidatus Daviesbacteria bacterium]|nr:DNA polymerase/3'-5' exonuclease PolX [Candidatus Daviesbacteria bacterium]
MEISNQQLAKIFRNVAAAYTLKKIGNIFQIRAYENAADAIEHSTAEVQDLWQEGKLSEIPTLGEKLQDYLDELFTKGKVKHFEQVEKGIPAVVFDLLDIGGVGPKNAAKLAELGVKDLEDLKKKIKSGELVSKGFSAKIAQNIMLGLLDLDQKDHRMLLPYAFAQADKILNYLKKSPDILEVHPLGSLRRMVATVGDLDFSVSSEKEKEVVEYFCKMPGVSRVVDKGENKATIVLTSGIQVDLLVGKPESYGALLQHFTGSKAHNIKLRTLAQQKGFSLSEYGVKNVTSNKLQETRTEEEFYKLLGMQTPPPEIREDTDEIEAATAHKLPELVDFEDIKGDLHIHSNLISQPSHDVGANSVEEIVSKAKDLGYSYIGITDHQPSQTGHTISQTIRLVEKKKKIIEEINSSQKSVRVLNLLEVDILPDGSLSLSEQALKLLDFAIASVHSSFNMPEEKMTQRILKALESPYVKALGHPTGRLIGKRDSYEADWRKIFEFAAKNKKALEINAHPNRLDLRDDLVRTALSFDVKFVINTDAHEVSQMDNMRFGVAGARRGWATKKDVVNTWDWTDLAKWFRINL